MSLKARHIGIAGLTAAAAILGSTVAVADAGAHQPAARVVLLTAGSKHFERGQDAVIQASVPKGDWCRLSLSSPGGVAQRSATSRAKSALAQFEWTVSSNASAQQLITVSCAASFTRFTHGEKAISQSELLSVSGHSSVRGTLTAHIKVVYPVSNALPFTGKGGGSYPAYGTVLIAGASWLDGHGVTVYSDGSDGGDGYYQCVELVNRLITSLKWSPTIWGNANQIYADASTAYFNKYPNGSGYKPVAGDIVVWGGNTYGHVQVVNANNGSNLTVVEQNASPSGYNVDPISASGSIPSRDGYYVIGFLHAKADNIGQAPAPAPAPAPVTAPVPTPTPAPTQAPTPAPTPTTGGTSSTSTPTPAPAPTYYNETVGSVAHTWTNYSDAGGTEGPEIASNQAVAIACKVTGFKVADGNTWWYRIASSPWNGNYYVSADAFYNNGATSGSLLGTPFVDPAVPNC